MTTYLITYDLRGSRDYEALIDAIKGYPKWARIMDSTWAICTSNSASGVRDALKKTMETGDRLFVLKSGVQAAWSNVECSNDWLKENL